MIILVLHRLVSVSKQICLNRLNFLELIYQLDKRLTIYFKLF
jgi:hypothetical protein